MANIHDNEPPAGDVERVSTPIDLVEVSEGCRILAYFDCDDEFTGVGIIQEGKHAQLEAQKGKELLFTVVGAGEIKISLISNPEIALVLEGNDAVILPPGHQFTILSQHGNTPFKIEHYEPGELALDAGHLGRECRKDDFFIRALHIQRPDAELFAGRAAARRAAGKVIDGSGKGR